jgi:TRAP-type C4-dicarboxylate transport system permease small subunit
MQSLAERIDKDGERWLMLVFYSMIVAVIAVEVFRRFVLSYSSVWGEEVARYAFIYLVWIGAAAAIRDRAHIRIDIVTQLLSPRGRAGLYLFGDFATLVLAVIGLYWSIKPVMTSIEFGSVTHGLRISQAWFFAAVPLGFAMILFRIVQSMRRDYSDLREGRPVFEGRRLFD